MKVMLKRIHLPNWILLVLTLVFVLRIPSFFDPYYYGDEMIYLTLGEAVKSGLTLYRDIHDNKPPLLYLIAAVAGNVFWFRAILAAWMLGTTVIFWRLTERLFPKEEKIQKIAVTVFAILTCLPLFEGQISNAELFMIGPTMLGFYLLLQKGTTNKNVFIAGLLFSTATLFKVPAAFDMLAIYFLWVVNTKLTVKSWVTLLKRSIILALGFLTPIVLTFIWYSWRGAFNEYLIAAFLQNVGYLSSFRPEQVRDPFWVRNMPLLVRGGMVLVVMVILYVFRKKLSKNFLFLVAWLAFGLFAVALPERPYPHYLVQVLPPISAFIGILVARNNIEQSLAVIPLFFATLIPVRFDFWYYPSLPYYQNFVRFASGKLEREAYFDTFNDRVNGNYKIANYLARSVPQDENVFVWGDSPSIYALSRRRPPLKYVANYHINDFSNRDHVLSSLKADPPLYIVILPHSEIFTQLTEFADTNYYLLPSMEGARIWKLMSLGVSSAVR